MGIAIIIHVIISIYKKIPTTRDNYIYYLYSEKQLKDI